MITYKEAQQIIGSLAHSFGREQVALDNALGRVLAEDVFADRDYPPFNRAAMDGFAARSVDIEAGISVFKIVDTIFAGAATEKVIVSGECYKIMTGASVPPSADVVVRREDAEESNGHVSFVVTDIRPFQNIARKGEDLQSGGLVVNKSTRCNVSVIGLLASVGKCEVIVEKLPSVAIITTGNEVVPVDETVSEVQIRNSNVHVIKALLKRWDMIPAYVQHVQDDEGELQNIFSSALSHDIVIVSGGVSAGDADYVPAVLNRLNVTQLFHKVAIRPGKPFWCGSKGTTMVFALPGNPLSCLVTFTIFIQHYLQTCFGLPPFILSLPLSTERKQKVKLDEFIPVKFMGSPSQFSPLVFNGSGDIRLGYEAQAFALHPSYSSFISAGDLVEAYPIM